MSAPARKTYQQLATEAAERVEAKKLASTGEAWPAVPASASLAINTLVRGALFGVSSQRELFESKRIFTLGGVEIIFSGDRLNQSDLIVFETVLKLAGGERLGTLVDLRAGQIFEGMGVTNCGKNLDRLLVSLNRP